MVNIYHAPWDPDCLRGLQFPILLVPIPVGGCGMRHWSLLHRYWSHPRGAGTAQSGLSAGKSLEMQPLGSLGIPAAYMDKAFGLMSRAITVSRRFLTKSFEWRYGNSKGPVSAPYLGTESGKNNKPRMSQLLNWLDVALLFLEVCCFYHASNTKLHHETIAKRPFPQPNGPADP